jgi:hypothetical protein
VATRDAGSRIFRDNVEPPADEAFLALGRGFADHPMVNVAVRLSDGRALTSRDPKAVQAFVIAEVVRRGEFAEIPPGGEYPTIEEEPITEACLVHARPWMLEPGPEEQAVARDLLEGMTAQLPLDLWVDGL